MQTANGEVHNIWWFKDPSTGSAKYAFIGEEGPGNIGVSALGDIHVVDVSNMASPREVAFYTVAGAGTHNFSMDEANGILYAAYYNGGVRALDVRGDLESCTAAQKTAPRNQAVAICDLSKMGRELAVGLKDLSDGTTSTTGPASQSNENEVIVFAVNLLDRGFQVTTCLLPHNFLPNGSSFLDGAR